MNLSLDVLRDRSARALFAGQFVSQVCDKMMSLGLVWAITEEYSPRWIPWFIGASALPHLLLSLSAGPWMARFGALRTVIWTDVYRGLLWLGLFAVWGGVSGDARLPALFALSFAANLGSALFNPAIMTLPLTLVDASLMQRLTALIDACFSAGNVLGPWVSTMLYPVVGLRGLFLFNGLSYLVAAFCESRIPRPVSAGTPDGDSSAPSSVMTILRGDSLVRFMLGSFLLMNLFLAPVMIFLPLFAKSVYDGGIGALAFLESAFALGTVLGSTVLSLAHLEGKSGKRIIACTALVALSYCGFAWSHQLWLGCLLVGALGVFLSMANVLILTLFQTRPRPQDVPTVMSLVNLISIATLPLSMGVIGLIIERTDFRMLAIGFSAVLLALAFLTSLNRSLREGT